jgi:hypothetical protein
VVEGRKRGLWVYYRLALPCVAEFVGCLEGSCGVGSVRGEAVVSR